MKYTLTFIITLILFSCSNQTDEESDNTISNEIEIVEVTKKKVRIGDTIILKGKNLDKITSFKFKTIDDILDNLPNMSPFERNSEEVKIIVPTLTNEVFELFAYQNNSIINSTSLNLIGTFPLKFNFQHDDVNCVKIVSEKTAFVAAEAKLYKTTDGGYNWKMIKDFGSYIGSNMFFLDDNNGWVGENYNNNFTLYHTQDGGNTFNKIFEKGFSYSPILNIYFSSPTDGYLIGNDGEIYQTNDNNNFDLIYNSSTSTAGSDFSFNAFSFYNNNLIAAGENSSNGKSILLQRINNIFSYSIFDTWTWDVQLLDESQAYISNNVNNNYKNEENIFFANNITSSNWIKAGNQYIKYFHFINKNKGIGINYEENGNQRYSVIYETYDGGKNWINKFNFNNFEYSKDVDLYNNYGLITGYRGKIWKHIFE